jgi:cytochrome c oxidase assembly protein subunit 15
VVTGSGPHAGDIDSPRNGLNPLQVSQLHADLVFLFVGLTVGLLFAVRAAGRPATVRRAVLVLLGLELAQGTIGFVQYFTDLPVVLVGFHLLGAALVSAAATWMLLAVREGSLEMTKTTAGPHPRGQALPSSSH